MVKVKNDENHSSARHATEQLFAIFSMLGDYALPERSHLEVVKATTDRKERKGEPKPTLNNHH